MTLWFALAVMTAAAVFAVLWPLSRRREPAPAGNDVRVYRDQLEEIARDRAAGRIGETESEAARVEVSRRLLAAADNPAGSAAASSLWGRRVVAIAALVLLPAGAATLYLALGSPLLPGQPLTARLVAPGSAPITQLVAQVEAHLERDPKDGRGWEVLAPVYMQLGRFDDAAKAWRNTIAYSGATAEREAALGEALVGIANGVVTAEAASAFQRALALDASDVKAHYFIGLSAAQDGRREEAAAIWRKMLASAPADAPWAGFVRSALARIEDSPNVNTPAPSAEDVAAAADLDPAQRQQMIAGMVDRLANRLKNDGGDIDGWLRLVRAYTVLGEREKARSAAADARRSIGNDTEKLRRIDELIKGLGLES
jgi:cytochrome c-type biogenesis protein CcmH